MNKCHGQGVQYVGALAILVVLSGFLPSSKRRKEVVSMVYTKPRIVSVPDALSVIQSTPLQKGMVDAFDGNAGYPQRVTISAYEGDE